MGLITTTTVLLILYQFCDINISLIKRYWFQYKKIEVILAYLQIVHHVAVLRCIKA